MAKCFVIKDPFIQLGDCLVRFRLLAFGGPWTSMKKSIFGLVRSLTVAKSSIVLSLICVGESSLQRRNN